MVIKKHTFFNQVKNEMKKTSQIGIASSGHINPGLTMHYSTNMHGKETSKT